MSDRTLHHKADAKGQTTEDKLIGLNRAMPAAYEAEKGLLSAVVNDPAGDRLAELRAALTPEAIYDVKARIIFDKLLDLNNRNVPITMRSITDALRESEQLEKIGGPGEISALFSEFPTPAEYQHYLKMVRARWMLRRLIAVCTDGISAAQTVGSEASGEADAGTILGATEQQVFDLVTENMGASSGDRVVIDSAEMTDQWIEVINDIYTQRGRQQGIKLGIADLDRTFGGFGVDSDGDMLLACGFPGTGKSVFGVSALEQIAIGQDVPTLVFPLEMGRIGYMHRLGLGRAEVDVKFARNGMFSEHAITTAIPKVVPSIQNAPIFWDNSAFIEIAELRAKVQVCVRKHGVRCVIIDHFGQLRPSTKQGRSDPLQAEREIMEGLHAMRRELGVFVILLMQLNKAAADKSSSVLPVLADIKGASEKSEYATHVCFLRRRCIDQPWHLMKEERQNEWKDLIAGYRKDLPQCWSSIIDTPSGMDFWQRDYEQHASICVRKNRHGATPDSVPVRFIGEYQRFCGRTTAVYSNNPALRQVSLPGWG